MIRKTIACLLLLAALSRPAGAQQPDSARGDTLRFRLRPVEVSVLRGSSADLRTPAAITQVSKAAIQDGQLTVGIDEALAVVPGVVVNNRYNFSLGSRIAVRGLGARAAFGVRGVRLLVDGIPLTMPDGQANVNNLDLGSAGRIEVLRGPASSLYGNAAGGVVALETEAAPQTRFAAQLRTVAGDVGRDGLDRMMKNQVKVGGQQGRADYLLSFARLESDGFRDHSATRQSQVNARVGLQQSERTRWTVLFNYADSPLAENPGSLPIDSANARPSMAWPRNTATGAGEITTQGQGGVAFEHNAGASRFRVSAYGLTRSLQNPLPFAYILLDRSGGGLRAQYSRDSNVSGHEVRLMLGSDVEIQSDDRREFNNNNGQQGTTQTRDQTDGVRGVGPFAQIEAAITDRFSVTLGARYDAVRFQIDDRFLTDNRDDSGNRTLSAFSPRFALLYSLNETTSLYGSVGTAFQTPTTTELINRPPVSGQPCCPSGLNDQLDPQRALNFEAGLKGSVAERVRYEAVVYQMNVQDALVPFQVAQADGREFFRNAGETRHRGVELALSALLSRVFVLETAYTYSKFTFVDDGIDASAFEGNDLPGVPQHHLFARLRVQPHPRVSLEVEDEYTGEYFANDANTASNPAANIIDGRVLLNFGRNGLSLRPFIALNNITDEQYNSSVVVNAAGARFYEPAPRRNLYLGATLGFGGW